MVMFHSFSSPRIYLVLWCLDQALRKQVIQTALPFLLAVSGLAERTDR